MEKREAPGGGHWSRLHIVIACAGRHFKATGDRPGVREHCPRLTCIISLLHLHRVCPMSCARGHGGGRWRGKVWGDVWSSGPLTRPACLCISHRQDNPHGRLPSSCQGLGVWSLGGGHDLAADAWLAETRVRWSPCFSQVAGPPCFSQVAPSSMFPASPLERTPLIAMGADSDSSQPSAAMAWVLGDAHRAHPYARSPQICATSVPGLRASLGPAASSPFALRRQLGCSLENTHAPEPRACCALVPRRCARVVGSCVLHGALWKTSPKRGIEGALRGELERSLRDRHIVLRRARICHPQLRMFDDCLCFPNRGGQHEVRRTMASARQRICQRRQK